MTTPATMQAITVRRMTRSISVKGKAVNNLDSASVSVGGETA